VPIELQIVIVLRALVEVAGYFMLGQAALYILAGQRREQNVVYALFKVLTRPVFRLTRALAPKAVLERHLPFVAFGLLFWSWIALAFAKRYLCGVHQLQCGF
jgi:hypothetical protein